MKPILLPVAAILLLVSAGCFENLFTSPTPVPSPSPAAGIQPSPSPTPASEVVAAALTVTVEGSGNGDNQRTWHVNNIADFTYTFRCRDASGSESDCTEQPISVFWDNLVFPCKYLGAGNTRFISVKCEQPIDELIIGASADTSDGRTLHANFYASVIQ